DADGHTASSPGHRPAGLSRQPTKRDLVAAAMIVMQCGGAGHSESVNRKPREQEEGKAAGEPSPPSRSLTGLGTPRPSASAPGSSCISLYGRPPPPQA